MESKDFFFKLVRLGLGIKDNTSFPKIIDWFVIQDIANKQGLSGIVLDGIGSLPIEIKPEKKDLLQWIGEVLRSEQVYAMQEKRASALALLFKHNGIRTYVLKGTVVAECYPKPEHRVSSDMDCFLLPDEGVFDAWALGNDIVREEGFDVSDCFYKNSTFYLPGLTVENHQFIIPFRGNNRLKFLEIMLQSMMKEDKGDDRFDGTCLFRPPVMVSALFLIEHAYSHFLHEGLTWRHVLDWMMFSRAHTKEIDWYNLEALIDEFGFRKFYDSYYRLGKYLIGEIDDVGLSELDKRMLEDVWSELDLHDTTGGLKGKLNLVGNTWRARWKYHYFADISMIHALWIQTKGVLFIKNPKLD